MFTTRQYLTSWKLPILRVCMVAILATMVFQGALIPPALAEEESVGSEFGMGVGSFIATLPYGCVKLAYAGMGAIIGGFAYLLTGANADAAGKIWDQTMRGTYVITPSHLSGEQPVRFFGAEPSSM